LQVRILPGAPKLICIGECHLSKTYTEREYPELLKEKLIEFTENKTIIDKDFPLFEIMIDFFDSRKLSDEERDTIREFYDYLEMILRIADGHPAYSIYAEELEKGVYDKEKDLRT
jgi:hypothetical protein